MRKFITTLAIVGSLAVTGIAGAQSIVPGGTTGTSTGGMMTSTTSSGTSGGTTGDTSGNSSVGVPNTGLGGDAAIYYGILAASGVVAIGAALYALRSQRRV